jgi:hypothetical protein
MTTLLYIINLSLSTGQFPDQLKIAKVEPLYKKGCETEVGNYRPVSLISDFSKLKKKIIKKRLLSFLNKHSVAATTQLATPDGGLISGNAPAKRHGSVAQACNEKQSSRNWYRDSTCAFTTEPTPCHSSHCAGSSQY